MNNKNFKQKNKKYLKKLKFQKKKYKNIKINLEIIILK